MSQARCAPFTRVNGARSWSNHLMQLLMLRQRMPQTHDCDAIGKLRILFVDDEPPVLTAIERQLRKDRGRWEMVFVVGALRALEEIRKGCFTVVVSDFRMPIVDGVALLNTIADACPATVQIMLSGDAEAQGLAHKVPALHELLAKPCDAATLRGAIERGISSTQATVAR